MKWELPDLQGPLARQDPRARRGLLESPVLPVYRARRVPPDRPDLDRLVRQGQLAPPAQLAPLERQGLQVQSVLQELQVQ
jgi:hypothetical protein